MKKNGFLKLYRSLIDWEWFTDKNTLTVWLYCLCRANWQESKWQGITIPKGSFITSIKTIAKDCKMSEREVRTAICHLKSTNNLTSKTTNKATLLTVEKWAIYQGGQFENDKQNDKQSDIQTTNKRQTNDIQTTTDKEYKNNNKSLRSKDLKKGEGEEALTPKDIMIIDPRNGLLIKKSEYLKYLATRSLS